MSANLSKSTDTTEAKKGSFVRLSSGLTVSAVRDVAAFNLESLERSLERFTKVERSLVYGIDIVRVARKGLTQVSSLIHRMRELATYASACDLTDSDRGFLENRFTSLRQELAKITSATKVRNVRPLCSPVELSFDFVVWGDSKTFNLVPVAPSELGIHGGSLQSELQSLKTVFALDTAMVRITGQQQDYGLLLERLQRTLANTQIQRTNLYAASSSAVDLECAER